VRRAFSASPSQLASAIGYYPLSMIHRLDATPAWTPTSAIQEQSNLTRLIRDREFPGYAELFGWSVAEPVEFWEEMVRRLGIGFRRPPEDFLDLSEGIENARWLAGARLNIADSCFHAPGDAVAIIHRVEGGALERWSYDDLSRLAKRVAGGLTRLGYSPGDAIAIDMPMSAESIAIYLGVLFAGCAVVSIADSFAPDEIATRLRLADTKAIFTEDFVLRGGKALALFEKVVSANAPSAIVRSAGGPRKVTLRPGDRTWDEFLPQDDVFEPISRDAEDVINVLFSSGTTGDPKAIPWTQTTPIKCAADGFLHQDIHAGDVVAWPTNLGWMMGPWLIFATLINRGTLALYVGAPGTAEFCEFVRDAEVSVLGLVPSLVKGWRAIGALDDLQWPALRVLTSTGEASDADDYRWLMERTGAPVIEYCGGTELGGAYVTGTVLHPAIPGTFTTPALGLDLVLIDDEGKASSEGEVFLRPPSVGLSTRLLNRDHHEVYYAGTPRGPRGTTLRRHGDRMQRLTNGYLRAQGRADDTMNLGGIKVSSAEIERVLNRLAGVHETAAVAIPPVGGGPERLVVFTVLDGTSDQDEERLLGLFRKAIREELNPLFRLADIQLADFLPRTASNKVMRRLLRDRLSVTEGGGPSR
jgi:acetyl-CoA synthetase